MKRRHFFLRSILKRHTGNCRDCKRSDRIHAVASSRRIAAGRCERMADQADRPGGAASGARKAAGVTASGLSEIWLPFVDSFRTICRVPRPDIQALLAGLVPALSLQEPAGSGGAIPV